MISNRSGFFVFGRAQDEEGEYDPWWPLWHEDGAQIAASVDDAATIVRERLALGGEHDWRELAIVPAEHFYRRLAAPSPGEDAAR